MGGERNAAHVVSQWDAPPHFALPPFLPFHTHEAEEFFASAMPVGQGSPPVVRTTADFLFLVTQSGAEATDFSAQMSQFSFLSSSVRPGLEFRRPHISHFSILGNKSKDAHGLEMTQF